MNKSVSGQSGKGLSACGLATLLLGTSLAIAKSYDIAIDTVDMQATPVDQSLPAFPDSRSVGKRQEGLVEVSFVVTHEGRVSDPIVTQSVGGTAFEDSAIDAVETWTFEPGSEELARNTVRLRFEHAKDDGKASRDFLRRYRNIAFALANNRIDKARKGLNQAVEAGGWNLYETTVLNVLEARLCEAESDDAGRLAALRKAMFLGDEEALNEETKRQLLKDMVRVETSMQRFMAARESLRVLRSVENSNAVLEELRGEIQKIEAMSLSEEIVVDATIDESRWVHRPSHRSFTIESVDGEIERIEARCDTHRLKMNASSGQMVEIPSDWGSCDIYVFGESGTQFHFVEISAGTEAIAARR
ncbi:MAG: TonB family protein [Pseudomonadota bacterium]